MNTNVNLAVPIGALAFLRSRRRLNAKSSIRCVKFILPALTEATSPHWRPIKYSLFPPLGLATLAAYLDPDLEISLQDEHVEKLDLNDQPDLVIIQVYITNAYRAYRIADHYRARGSYVALGGLHVTSLPDEAAPHADTIFIGPGEHTFPQFLRDLASGTPQRRYESSVRTLEGLPPIRRDLIQRLNGSFVFGLDGDDRDVFPRTVDWAVQAGITTATFHILTPYPGTALFADMAARNRIETRNWDLYDTRHVVYRPSGLAPDELKRGYDWAYESFYRWSSILEAASAHKSAKHSWKHFFYSAGWKKFETSWDLLIRIKQLSQMRPLLEAVLAPVTQPGFSSNVREVTRSDHSLKLWKTTLS